MQKKNGKIRIVLCLLLFLYGGFFSTKESSAASWGSVELTAEEAVLMDADTGAVLFEKNGEEKGYPASITKVLTLKIGE